MALSHRRRVHSLAGFLFEILGPRSYNVQVPRRDRPISCTTSGCRGKNTSDQWERIFIRVRQHRSAGGSAARARRAARSLRDRS